MTIPLATLNSDLSSEEDLQDGWALVKPMLLTRFILPRVVNFRKLVIIGYHGKKTEAVPCPVITVLILDDPCSPGRCSCAVGLSARAEMAEHARWASGGPRREARARGYLCPASEASHS